MLEALMMALAAPPEIEFNASVRADRVTIVKQGRVAATAQANPDGGSRVTVEAPKANGRKTLRNVKADVHLAAKLAEPGQLATGQGQAEPAPAQ